MTPEQKGIALAEALQECQREPELPLKEIAVIIAMEIKDISGFLKEYKKQLKKEQKA